MGRERKDKWDENGHKLPELWKLIAGALGLVEKTEEHLKCAGGTCLIHEPRLEGPFDPSILTSEASFDVSSSQNPPT